MVTSAMEKRWKGACFLAFWACPCCCYKLSSDELTDWGEDSSLSIGLGSLVRLTVTTMPSFRRRRWHAAWQAGRVSPKTVTDLKKLNKKQTCHWQKTAQRK